MRLASFAPRVAGILQILGVYSLKLAKKKKNPPQYFSGGVLKITDWRMILSTSFTSCSAHSVNRSEERKL